MNELAANGAVHLLLLSLALIMALIAAMAHSERANGLLAIAVFLYLLREMLVLIASG